MADTKEKLILLFAAQISDILIEERKSVDGFIAQEKIENKLRVLVAKTQQETEKEMKEKIEREIKTLNGQKIWSHDGQSRRKGSLNAYKNMLKFINLSTSTEE